MCLVSNVFVSVVHDCVLLGCVSKQWVLLVLNEFVVRLLRIVNMECISRYCLTKKKLVLVIDVFIVINGCVDACIVSNDCS